MKTLLVGYDLDKPAQDYKALVGAIKAAGSWWHYLDSTWLVVTELTAEGLRNELRGHVDASHDKLLVIDVSGDAAAWVGFPNKASDWLKENL